MTEIERLVAYQRDREQLIKQLATVQEELDQLRRERDVARDEVESLKAEWHPVKVELNRFYRLFGLGDTEVVRGDFRVKHEQQLAIVREDRLRALKLAHQYTEDTQSCEDAVASLVALIQRQREVIAFPPAVRGVKPAPKKPIPMILNCPECGGRHIDRGEFATKPHNTHACQHCGMVWRPAIVPTCGVRFLPGFKDGEEKRS